MFASGQFGNIPEVCICFDRKLFRGNKCTKYSSNSLNAYTSPNYPLLGAVDGDRYEGRRIL